MRSFLLLLTVCVSLLALAAGGVLAAFANYEATYQGRVYPGVSALGVDLAGRTWDEAFQLLAERTAPAASRPITLSYAGQQWRYSASELGLQLDVGRLAAQSMAVGRQGFLPDRLRAVWELRQQSPSLGTVRADVNPEAARLVVRGLAARIDRPKVDAALSLGPGYEVRVTRAQSGRNLDQGETVRRLHQALAQGAEEVELAVVEAPPAVQDGQVLEAAEQVRNVLSGPLIPFYGQRVWSVSLDELRRMLRLERRASGPFEVVLDRTPLEALARRMAREIEQTPIDARFQWAEGKLEVLRPSRPRLSIEPEQAVRAMLAAAVSPNHVFELPVVVTRSGAPMEERYLLGIKELIEASSTSFAGAVPAKRHNIRLAAERIHGTVVPPGATFSFNQTVGPTTLQAGFRWGYAIQGSADGPKTVPSVAGGICQVATTLFHPVFWAGYSIGERYPHSYWIPSYTSKGVVGLDTTVDETAGLDFRFTNPGPHHLLIQAWVDGADRLHFALYGTKPEWTVEVNRPVQTNIQPSDPTPVEEEEPIMPYGQRVVVEAARDGFDVRVVRKVTDGGEKRTLALVSRYQPSRNVTLVGILGRPEPTPGPEVEATAGQAAPGDQGALPKPNPGAASDGVVAPEPIPAASPTPQPQAPRP